MRVNAYTRVQGRLDIVVQPDGGRFCVKKCVKNMESHFFIWIFVFEKIGFKDLLGTRTLSCIHESIIVSFFPIALALL